MNSQTVITVELTHLAGQFLQYTFILQIVFAVGKKKVRKITGNISSTLGKFYESLINFSPLC